MKLYGLPAFVVHDVSVGVLLMERVCWVESQSKRISPELAESVCNLRAHHKHAVRERDLLVPILCTTELRKGI